MKILFVCRGNVGRSQIASVLFNKYSRLKSFSAGTKVLENEGQKLRDLPLAEPVIRFMEKEKIDVSENIRKQVNEEMIKNFDKIINMSEPEKTPDFIKNNPKAFYWNIKDPKGMDDEFYAKTVKEIKEKVKNFIKEYNL